MIGRSGQIFGGAEGSDKREESSAHAKARQAGNLPEIYYLCSRITRAYTQSRQSTLGMKDNNYLRFSASMKMADAVLLNYTLVSVLPRFDIHLGFGDKTLSEVCRKYGVNESFFLMVCNIQTYDDYFPTDEELLHIDMGSLIDYLKKSHDYYTGHRIATIERRLESMTGGCEASHHAIMRKFFTEYRQEVIGHFDYEEQTVFPYVRELVAGRTSVNYHINQYEENHTNIDDKLSDLKNIIIKYLPESCSSEDRSDILTEIFLFEQDLEKHTRIEDKILIPLVRQIEKGYENHKA